MGTSSFAHGSIDLPWILSAIPEWLALLLTLLGGTASGSFVGAVARSRLEDRRALLTMWPLLGLGSDVRPDVQYGGLPTSFWALDGLRAESDLYPYLAAVGAANEALPVVARLPWLDRQLFFEFLESNFPTVSVARVGDEMWRYLHQNGEPAVPLDRSALVPSAIAQIEAEARAISAERDTTGSVLYRRSAAMEKYLLDMVNPRALTRVKVTLLKLGRLFTKKWSWSKPYRPWWMLNLDRHLDMRTSVS